MAIRGGKNLERVLAKTVEKLTTANTVRVGFLEGTMYPSTGRSIERLLKGRDRLNATGPFQKGGKPAALRKYRKRQRESTGPQDSSTVTLPVATVAYWNNFGTSRAPARPFFSDMISESSPTWGSDLTKILIAAGYNSEVALGRMGSRINDQLVKKIVDWPADNAPLTVAIKGFNAGLRDTMVMARSTGYEVIL